jgi:ATP adenylyltransferase
MAYVGGAHAPAGCVFCDALTANDDRGRLVLLRGRHAYLILNAFPYAAGHLMAALNRHVADLQAATADELAETMSLLRTATIALAAEYRPDGFNVGANLGAAAGAGIKGHLHFHVVPRWSGDSNFMAVVGDTRVLPETLDTTYDRLRKRLESDS